MSAGIGGGFAPLSPGDIAVAAVIVFADLGAETPDGFVPVDASASATERYRSRRRGSRWNWPTAAAGTSGPC